MISLKRLFLPKSSPHFTRHHSGIIASTMKSANEISERCMQLQAVHEHSLPAKEPYVIRLDGVGFKRFTSGMKKPFDPRFTRAMLLTTKDLLEKCVARTAYCQSDEISLVFAGEPTNSQIVYGGRVQKIVSVMASLAAARFNWHLQRMPWSSAEERENAEEGFATFDARIFSTGDEDMAMESIFWRHALDGKRNSISMVGHYFFPHSKLKGVSLQDTLKMLQSQQSIDPYTKYPASSMYGVFMKRQQYDHIGFNPKTGQTIPTIRSKIDARSFDWINGGGSVSERTEMIMAKYWSAEHPSSLEPINL